VEETLPVSINAAAEDWGDQPPGRDCPWTPFRQFLLVV